MAMSSQSEHKPSDPSMLPSDPPPGPSLHSSDSSGITPEDTNLVRVGMNQHTNPSNRKRTVRQFPNDQSAAGSAVDATGVTELGARESSHSMGIEMNQVVNPPVRRKSLSRMIEDAAEEGRRRTFGTDN